MRIAIRKNGKTVHEIAVTGFPQDFLFSLGVQLGAIAGGEILQAILKILRLRLLQLLSRSARWKSHEHQNRQKNPR
jgi:hypothetical protein